MTVPTGSDPNRPAAFDFGLSAPSTAPGDAPLTRRSARQTRVDSRSLAVPIIVTLLIFGVIGGAGFTAWYLVKASEDQVKADSVAFCNSIAATPGALSQPGFGWPTDSADLTTTLALMQDYRDRWKEIAAVSPPTIKPDSTAVAEAATTITKGIEASKSIDRPASLAQMDAVTSKTAIPAWVAKYC
jgi:hypothetical protein